MAFVLWVAINFVSRIVTKSIYELSLGTNEISNGNLTHRLVVNSGDEIGELASKFNNMTKNLYNMIQERDEAINALKASEEKFNKAFHHSADVIAIARLKDKLYIEINESFLRIFEYVLYMVLSLKAGGVGLNLTAANHVIHFDRMRIFV